MKNFLLSFALIAISLAIYNFTYSGVYSLFSKTGYVSQISAAITGLVIYIFAKILKLNHAAILGIAVFILTLILQFLLMYLIISGMSNFD